jgi:hypothetical protein
MKKTIFLRQNLGIGDHVFLRSFLDPIKNQYQNIYITHATDALAYWFNNNQDRLKFNTQLANLIYNEQPYKFILNANYPFFPNDRIVKELNSKPIRPNLDCLCEGKSLDINNYIVITTKVRQFPKDQFERIKEMLSATLLELANRFTIVILGERTVERTKEYDAEVNRNQIFGLYDYLINVLPQGKFIDLTIPTLGNTPPTLSQFQQDCLLIKESVASISFGIGGNFWINYAVAKQIIGLRSDNETGTDLILDSSPNLFLTKDMNQFIQNLNDL